MMSQFVFPTSERLEIGRYVTRVRRQNTLQRQKETACWLDGVCISLEVVGGGEEEKEGRGLENGADPEFDEDQADRASL